MEASRPPLLELTTPQCVPNNPSIDLIRNTFLCLVALCASSFAGEISKKTTPPAGTAGQVIQGVKTTAYTHSEGDHIEYGARSAVGTGLKYGKLRSAAADWSIYPMGTVFQIEGDSNLYIVDDYGSALVGTKTIDLYKPSQNAMAQWGARKVTIRIIKWGSYERSLAILRPRQGKASHVREMVSRLVSRSA